LILILGFFEPLFDLLHHRRFAGEILVSLSVGLAQERLRLLLLVIVEFVARDLCIDVLGPLVLGLGRWFSRGRRGSRCSPGVTFAGRRCRRRNSAAAAGFHSILAQ